MTWATAALVVLAFAALGALAGLVARRGVRLLVLAALSAGVVAALWPATCAGSQAATTTGDGGVIGWCDTAYGMRLPEWGRPDGVVTPDLRLLAVVVLCAAGTPVARRREPVRG
jgi:hypothetical protein